LLKILDMKSNFWLLLIALAFAACSENERTVADTDYPQTAQEFPKPETAQDSVSKAKLSDKELAALQKKCEEYYEAQIIPGAIVLEHLDEILSVRNTQLTANNRRFLTQLRQELANPDARQAALTIERTLFPVFKLKEGEVGIYGFPIPDLKDREVYSDISPERALLLKTDHFKGDDPGQYKNKLVHYPQVLQARYPKANPEIYLYTTKTTKRSSIKDFGFYEGECSEYYHYTFDTENIAPSDQLLFASRMPIDLIYENNAAFDDWFRSGFVPECDDCPHSFNLAKTYAKVKGTDDLYFMYADTFPLNDKLETPYRTLLLKGKDGKGIYLWSAFVDNVGCSCI
jgi:hypothetical protein